MAIFKRHKNKAGTAAIGTYAPDITFTAVDYQLPLKPETRHKAAGRDIKDFLEAAAPDELCGFFRDELTAAEDRWLQAQLARQTPDHQDANRTIALKHHSELLRLRRAISQAEAESDSLQAEINAWQQLHDKVNLHS